MKRGLVTAVTLLLMALPISAHANSLASTSPASGAVLVVAPNAVSVVGTSDLQADGNQLSVTDPKGIAVDDGSVTVAGTSVVVGLKPLTAAGVYTVTYTLLAAGETPLQGSYTFLYNAPADLSSAPPTPTPASSKQTTTTSGGSNGAVIFVIAIFLLGCAVLLFLIWYARTLLHNKQKKRRQAVRKKSAPSTRK